MNPYRRGLIGTAPTHTAGLLFEGDGGFFEQNSAQDTNAPALQPGDFCNTQHCINQATVPQQHHWQAEQETDPQHSCKGK